jgi:hypothetical protein
MDTRFSFETLVSLSKISWCHNSVDNNPKNHRSDSKVKISLLQAMEAHRAAKG